MLPTPRSVAFLVVCLLSVAFADDFKTIEGKEYKDATITRVESDGIVLRTKTGISKVYFVELPKEVQERFHHAPSTPVAAQRERTPVNIAAKQKDSPQADRGGRAGALPVPALFRRFLGIAIVGALIVIGVVVAIVRSRFKSQPTSNEILGDDP